MDRTSIFKPSLGEIKNWPERLVSQGSKMGLRDKSQMGEKWVSETISKEVENRRKSNFQI